MVCSNRFWYAPSVGALVGDALDRRVQRGDRGGRARRRGAGGRGAQVQRVEAAELAVSTALIVTPSFSPAFAPIWKSPDEALAAGGAGAVAEARRRRCSARVNAVEPVMENVAPEPSAATAALACISLPW